MIMHREATKIDGVLAVAKEFNIPPRAIVAFGEDVNDKELLEKVGCGVAMGNSIAEIKMIADEICDTNDQDGVAKWLAEKIIRMKET